MEHLRLFIPKAVRAEAGVGAVVASGTNTVRVTTGWVHDRFIEGLVP